MSQAKPTPQMFYMRYGFTLNVAGLSIASRTHIFRASAETFASTAFQKELIRLCDVMIDELVTVDFEQVGDTNTKFPELPPPPPNWRWPYENA